MLKMKCFGRAEKREQDYTGLHGGQHNAGDFRSTSDEGDTLLAVWKRYNTHQLCTHARGILVWIEKWRLKLLLGSSVQYLGINRIYALLLGG
jgi:hypothetical protein